MCLGCRVGSRRVSKSGTAINMAAATTSIIRQSTAPCRVTSGNGIRAGCAKHVAQLSVFTTPASTAHVAVSSRGKISQPWRLNVAIVTGVSYESHVIPRHFQGAMLHPRSTGVKHALPCRVKAWHPPINTSRHRLHDRGLRIALVFGAAVDPFAAYSTRGSLEFTEELAGHVLQLMPSLSEMRVLSTPARARCSC